jgi:PPOX class probable F420-dependent enzyme
MANVLPDPSTEFGARVQRRLREERVAWLTVVDRSNTPQPAPVWFVWDGESLLFYSDRNAKRLSHLRANPNVAFNFDSDGAGGDIVVLTGEAVEAPDEPPVPENEAYLAKYGKRITEGWGSAEEFSKTYAVPVRIHPRRVRGH